MIITKLTKKQEKKIPEYFNKWYKKFHNLEFDEDKTKEFVDWLYSLIGKPKPIKIILDSPLACQLAINILKMGKDSKLSTQLRTQLDSQLDSQLRIQLRIQLNSLLDKQLRSKLNSQLNLELESQLNSQLYTLLDTQLNSELRTQLWTQLDKQLSSQLDKQLWTQLDTQLRSQLNPELRSQLRTQLRTQLNSQLRLKFNLQLDTQLKSKLDTQLSSKLDKQLWTQLDKQLNSQLRTQLRIQLNSQLCLQLNLQLKSKKYNIDWWGDSSWFGYLCFYDFVYNELFPETKIDIFEQYINLCQNISSLITFDGIVFISRPPQFINFDEHDKLHCLHDKALLFKDEWGMNYVHGVYFEHDLFNKVFKNKTVTSKEILAIENVEQKAIIIQELGFEKIIDGLKDKILIDSQKKVFNKDKSKIVEYSLFKTKIIHGKDSHILKVEWWEKDRKRQTVLGVPNTINDVIEAVAWTCYTTKENWEKKLLMEA